MGWGTHEQWIPANGILPPEGPRNQLFLAQCGMNTWVRSFVPPNHQIIGMVIRHGEAFSISEYLTVWNENKQAEYR
jgi:homospermidine synthase